VVECSRKKVYALQLPWMTTSLVESQAAADEGN